MYESRGLIYGYRMYKYGLLVIFHIADDVEMASVQGEEAYRLADELDGLAYQWQVDNVLDCYVG